MALQAPLSEKILQTKYILFQTAKEETNPIQKIEVKRSKFGYYMDLNDIENKPFVFIEDKFDSCNLNNPPNHELNSKTRTMLNCNDRRKSRSTTDMRLEVRESILEKCGGICLKNTTIKENERSEHSKEILKERKEKELLFWFL